MTKTHRGRSKVAYKKTGESAKQQLTGSKQRLKIVRKLSTPRVSWVHGDEDGTRKVDGDVASFKEDVGGLRSYRGLHSADLLPDDGKHLQVDAIELVEAAPCPTGQEPFEELRHSHHVQPVTVKGFRL